MKVFYQISTPDNVEAELTLKGTIGDFKQLLAVINSGPSPNHWPQGSLRFSIKTIIEKASEQFEQEVPHDATL